jgi:hypothetical protein
MVTWETPVLGGKMRSPHGLDLTFVVDNTDIAGALPVVVNDSNEEERLFCTS